VVLAAGLGSRLGGEPKALFALDGRPLLERCAQALATVGFDRVAVITGHGAAQVQAWWEGAPRPLAAEFVHNPRYADLNNFHTLEIACDELADGSLLALNADIVFDPGVVANAVDAGGDLTLAVEGGRVDQEALKVRIADGRVRELGKHLAPEDSYGEFIGVSLLSPRGREAYAGACRIARGQGETTLYYEDIYSRIVDQVDARVSGVAAGTWAEIDTPEDVPPALAVARSIAGA
jgi:choline kinase